MCPMSSWKLSFFKRYTIDFQNSRFDMFSENYGTFWLFPYLNDTDETNGKFYFWLNNIFQGVFFLKPMKQIGNSIFTNFDFWHTLNQPWPTVRRRHFMHTLVSIYFNTSTRCVECCFFGNYTWGTFVLLVDLKVIHAFSLSEYSTHKSKPYTQYVK